MRLLLIDDHTMFRQGLILALRRADETLIVDEADSCAAAKAYEGKNAYDLILLDLRLPGMSGLEALDFTLQAFPETPVVVVSGEDDSETVRATIDKGAMGFVPKTASAEALRSAMQSILAGGVYLPRSAVDSYRLPPPLREPSAQPYAAPPKLTTQKREVLRWMIRGLPNKAIARELDVSVSTVKRHLEEIYGALGVHSRTEAVFAASKLGWRF